MTVFLSPEDKYRRLKGLPDDAPVPISMDSPRFPPGQARKLDEQRWAAREAAEAGRNRDLNPSTIRKAVRIGSTPASHEKDDWVGSLDAGIRAAADNVTLGMVNKLAAGADTILPLGKLINPQTTSVWETGDLGKAFDRNLAMQQRADLVADKAHPVARFAGNVAGSVIGPVPGRAAIAKAADYGVGGLIKAGVGAHTAKAIGVAGRGAGEGASQGFVHGLLSGGNNLDIPGALAAARDEAGQGVAGALAAAGVMHGFAKGIGSRIEQLPAEAKAFLKGGRYFNDILERGAKPTAEKLIDEATKSLLKTGPSGQANSNR